MKAFYAVSLIFKLLMNGMAYMGLLLPGNIPVVAVSPRRAQ